MEAVKERYWVGVARTRRIAAKGLEAGCRYCSGAHTEWECYNLCGCGDRDVGFLRANCEVCMKMDIAGEEEWEA